MWVKAIGSYAAVCALGVAGGVVGSRIFIQKSSESLSVDDNRSSQVDLMQYGWPSKCNIKVREGYVLSYDRRTRNAAWVCEHLTKEKLKKVRANGREKSAFKPDESTPPQFRIKPMDYANSGYDRGHLAPARDFSTSQKAIDESFLMTNISPQVGAGFNRSYWSRVECFIRHLTSIYPEVFVITGPLFLPKKDKQSGKYFVTYEVIGGLSNISVPTHFFKVVLAKKYDGTFVLGSFILPNKSIPNDAPLEKFEAPLDVIERQSGLIFFDKVPRAESARLCKDTQCKLPQLDFKKAIKVSSSRTDTPNETIQ